MVHAWTQRGRPSTANASPGCSRPSASGFAQLHPKSAVLFAEAQVSLLAGVPMSWMSKWAGGHPVYVDRRQRGGHPRCRRPRVRRPLPRRHGCDGGALPRLHGRGRRGAPRDRGGAAMMLPTEDAAWVGAELGRRFGVPLWSFTLSATDANRFAIRLCRQITKRSKILVFNWCYHGSVDETIITLDDGRPRAREGNVGPPVDPTVTTRVCEFNDLEALEASPGGGRRGLRADGAGADQHRDRAARGRLPRAACASCTRAAGTLLIIDETHTASARPRRLHRRLGPRAGPGHAGKWIGRRRSGRRPTGSAPRSASGSRPTRRPTTSTPAASAAPSRATPCRWPRRERRWARC